MTPCWACLDRTSIYLFTAKGRPPHYLSEGVVTRFFWRCPFSPLSKSPVFETVRFIIRICILGNDWSPPTKGLGCSSRSPLPRRVSTHTIHSCRVAQGRCPHLGAAHMMPAVTGLLLLQQNSSEFDTRKAGSLGIFVAIPPLRAVHITASSLAG